MAVIFRTCDMSGSATHTFGTLGAITLEYTMCIIINL